MDFLDRFDVWLAPHLHGQADGILFRVMHQVTWLGYRYLLLALVLGAGAFLAYRRHFRAMVVVLAVGVVSFGLVEVAKRVVHRPRPAGAVLEAGESPESFPSGHAGGSAAIYPTLALVLGRLYLPRPGQRTAAVAGAVALALLIGVSRLCLGVHYLSDVVAGWCAGLGCALLADWAWYRWVAPTLPGKPSEKEPAGGEPRPLVLPPSPPLPGGGPSEAVTGR
jgi:undecaprenyl-diphosphatase